MLWGEGAGLYDAVEAVGLSLCPALGINIPVGKDSLSMQTHWQAEGEEKTVTSPLSLIITAAAPVLDARKTLTPELQRTDEETCLLFIDLGEGANALGASVLAQCYSQTGQRPPDLDDPQKVKRFFSGDTGTQ